MENNFIEKSHGVTMAFFMRQKKVSQTRLAELTGIPRLTIHRIISGKQQLTLKYLIEIVDALDISIQRYVNRLKEVHLKTKMVVSND